MKKTCQICPQNKVRICKKSGCDGEKWISNLKSAYKNTSETHAKIKTTEKKFSNADQCYSYL
jgi:hypothetical protein